MNEAQKQVAAIQANAHNFKKPSRPVEDNTNPRALSSIDEIFTRLKAIGSVGNAFKTPQEEAIVKQEWMLALREEGVTKQEMIDDGIDAFRIKARQSRGVAWFPSIGEFIDMCLGSDDSLEYAQRALTLFNSGQKQTCTVGKMLVGQHHFRLKQMKASESNKLFIELYLELAKNNAIEPLEAFALPESVQLSPEQEKAKQARIQTEQDKFFGLFNQFRELNPQIPAETTEKAFGIKQGSLKSYNQSQKQIDEIKRNQLEAIKGKS